MKKSKEPNFSFFPWSQGEKPYFTSPDGWEWYIDESTQKWATREGMNKIKPLKNVMCFYVKKGDDITRCMIDNNQKVLCEDTSLEGMAWKIDMIRLTRSMK